jgi:hypothetical protein
MRKWLIMGIVCLFMSGVSGIAGAGPSGAASPKMNISGTYNVTFTSDQGQQQSAKIMIEDLKNGQVQASGDYKGYPVSIVGDLNGDVAQGGAVCSFNINKPGLVTGKAEIIIQLVDDKYQLQGQGSGSYSYLGSSGEVSGRVQGSRLDSTATSSNTLLGGAALILGLLIVIALIIYFIWCRRAKKTRT